MDETDSARDSWIEQAARLIRIRDARISGTDAESLARAIWERPTADRQDSAALNCHRTTAAAPLSVERPPRP